MCLIAYAPKGVEKYSEFFLEGLITSSKGNSDGIGYAYKDKSGAVVFSKGHTQILSVIDELRGLKLTKEDELVVHLRRTSHGSKSAEMCHPFILSGNDDLIAEVGPSSIFAPVLFHNGIFIDFIDRDKPEYSDTYFFAKDFLRNKDILSLLKKDKDKFMQLFKDIIKMNKLIVMYPHKEAIVKIGNFIEDRGHFFSNLSYRDTRVVDHGGSSFAPVPIPDRTPINVKEKEDLTAKFKQKVDKIINNPASLVSKPEVLLTKDNYHELILISTEDQSDIGIKKDDQYVLTEFNINKELNLVYSVKNPAIFAWVTMDDIYTKFTAVPRKSFVGKYSDYYRLKALISPITKTAVKNINRNLIKYIKNGYPKPTDNVDLEYKNRRITDLRYDAVCMFLNEVGHMINNPLNIPTKGEIKQYEMELEPEEDSYSC